MLLQPVGHFPVIASRDDKSPAVGPLPRDDGYWVQAFQSGKEPETQP